MKINYMIKYSWKSLIYKQDRLFTLLNIIAVTATMTVLVGLSGLLVSFQVYTESVLQKLPLCIEIFKSKDSLVQDLKEVEPQLNALVGFDALYKIVPTNLTFLNTNKIPYNIRGCTLSPHENFIIKDIFDIPVQFQSKEKLEQPFDEIGLIVSFDFLKKLNYLPEEAYFEKKETWKSEQLPKQLKILVTETNTSGNITSIPLPIPILAIVPNLQRAEYMITEDFYNLTLHWQHEFQYMLQDRNKKKLVELQPEIRQAYWILTDEECFWLEDHPDIIALYQQYVSVKLNIEFTETESGYEQRLTVNPLSEGMKLTLDQLNTLYQSLQQNKELENLGMYKTKTKDMYVRSWSDFLPIQHQHQYIQAALYMKERHQILSTLEELRTMGLFASSILERYIKTFENQEKFFKNALIIVFGLVLFLSSTVLFSTFYSSLLRKKKEIGIFKAYGASNFLVLMLMYIQSTMLIIVGCGLGIYVGEKIGKFLSIWINSFASLSDTGLKFILPHEYLLNLIILLVITCWIAVFIPSQIAMSIDPAEVVR
ncbi:MAG: FtsX-like permease family protein [Planctomycetes bacterium]|nr:FtsX-like permease family protein [Planctomycetota bacterium]HPY75025.1 FtsX-like permease family protein [Planctomycetota bacterium]HQB00820.1 FtsX-like permease family protein [Planctomycetota bacterium]